MSRAGKRTIVLRPGRALLKALLEAVEASERAAEVVDRVHDRRLACGRRDRAPVLERAVMREQDVEHRARKLPPQACRLASLKVARAAHSESGMLTLYHWEPNANSGKPMLTLAETRELAFGT